MLYSKAAKNREAGGEKQDRGYPQSNLANFGAASVKKRRRYGYRQRGKKYMQYFEVVVIHLIPGCLVYLARRGFKSFDRGLGFFSGVA